MTIDPRRVMANMLLMSAFEVCHPVQPLIQMETDDLAERTGNRSACRFHGYQTW